MIYSKTYKILLNHISHKIEILMETDTKYIFIKSFTKISFIIDN